jgi:hypothetical protein
MKKSDKIYIEKEIGINENGKYIYKLVLINSENED